MCEYWYQAVFKNRCSREFVAFSTFIGEKKFGENWVISGTGGPGDCWMGRGETGYKSECNFRSRARSPDIYICIDRYA